MEHIKQERRVKVSVGGTVHLTPEEQFTYLTNGKVQRRVESVSYGGEVHPGHAPYIRLVYRGHQIRKDGSVGAEFRDTFPSLRTVTSPSLNEVRLLVDNHVKSELARLDAAVEAGVI